MEIVRMLRYYADNYESKMAHREHKTLLHQAADEIERLHNLQISIQHGESGTVIYVSSCSETDPSQWEVVASKKIGG